MNEIMKALDDLADAVSARFEALERRIEERLAALAERPGPQGAKGETGPQGPAGPRGERGEKGDAGIPGPEGPRGERGERGEKGDAGRDGKDGAPGLNGKDGAPGERGPSGPQGERGERGEKGLDGRDGRDGSKGEKGDPGKDGKDGRDGISMADLDEAVAQMKASLLAEVRKGFAEFAAMNYRGVWKEGEEYLAGQWVTFGGSGWVCMADGAKERPSDGSDGWKLAIKRGRDARDPVRVGG